MQFEIRDAVQEDFEFIRQNPVENALKRYPPITVDGWAKTGLYGGVIIGCGGIVQYWPGCGEAWITVSKLVDEYNVQAFYCAKKILMMGLDELKLVRLQATARVDFPKSKLFLEALGFVYESTLEAYLPDGTDAYMYKIIRKPKNESV